VKKKLLQYGICSILGAAITVWIIAAEGLFQPVETTAKEAMFILCDALFVPGALLSSLGALIWVSTTGFFDALGYAAHVAGHMFLPFLKLERRSYYEYKEEKAEKRDSTVPYFIIIVGFGFLALSAISCIVWAVI